LAGRANLTFARQADFQSPAGKEVTLFTGPEIPRSKNLIPGTAASACAATIVATGVFLARTSFAHRQGPSLAIFPVQARNSSRGAFLGIHGGKGKTTPLARKFVSDYFDFIHRAMIRQHAPQVLFRDINGQVAQVQLITHDRCSSLVHCFSQGVPDHRVFNRH
jgi:hypothetical protein